MMRALAIIATSFVMTYCGLAADNAVTTQPMKAKHRAGEIAQAKVLKVFAVDDNKATYRGYLVKWKDSEVVVSDTLARSDLKEGDLITFSVVRIPAPDGQVLLWFEIPPSVSRLTSSAPQSK